MIRAMDGARLGTSRATLLARRSVVEACPQSLDNLRGSAAARPTLLRAQVAHTAHSVYGVPIKKEGTNFSADRRVNDNYNPSGEV